MLRVMIVDDHPVVREGLKQLLETEDDIKVVAEATNGLECLRLLERIHTDLIFMDIRMKGISGIETTQLICQKYPQAKVIILTIYEDDQYVTEAIQVGAKGYVLKNINRDELIKIARHVMEGKAFLDPGITTTIFNHLKQGEKNLEKEKKAQLTQRELEILKGIVAGQTDHTIGESLYISKHTVRSHIKSLYRKLGVSSKSQAVAKALHNGLITDDKSK